jgi:hypothetical protein
MSGPGRVLIMAEMHGRDLTRRHLALGLLIALPLSFYLATASTPEAVSSGGVGMAFAISGAALFSVLSSREVDQRLVLGGYRPVELLLGRFVFLGPLSLLIGAGFSVLMAIVSNPTRPWVMVLGMATVALVSVAFGLMVGAIVPVELEGTLVLIGVIGLQLAMRIDAPLAKVLPFYGARKLLASSMTASGPILLPWMEAAIYGLAMLAATWFFVSRRVEVVRHDLL